MPDRRHFLKLAGMTVVVALASSSMMLNSSGLAQAQGNSDGNSGGGNSGGGNSGGGNSGGGKTSGEPARGQPASPSASERSSDLIGIRHSDGITETIEDGRYELRDAQDRVIVNRPATDIDQERINSWR